MGNILVSEKFNFRVGDRVAVHLKIKEGEKERIQVFEGIVIKIKGCKDNKSFTVRKIAAGGMGVEKIFPFNCPSIAKIIVKKNSKVKKAKLYYLRKKVGRKAIYPN